jgi:hypothetical protein
LHELIEACRTSEHDIGCDGLMLFERYDSRRLAHFPNTSRADGQ